MQTDSRNDAVGDAVRIVGVTIAVSSDTSDNVRAFAPQATPVSDDTNSTGWFAPLDKPVKVPGGLTLKTLAEAGAYILDLPSHIKERHSWRHATSLLLQAASGKVSVKIATAQFDRALLMDRMYDRTLPTQPSVGRPLREG